MATANSFNAKSTSPFKANGKVAGFAELEPNGPIDCYVYYAFQEYARAGGVTFAMEKIVWYAVSD